MKTKTKFSLIISCLIALVVLTCGFLFASVPLKQVSAVDETTKRPPNALEQIYIDQVLNAEIVDYTEGMFETTNYKDLEESVNFNGKWYLYYNQVATNEEVILSEDVINKANAQREKYLKLEQPLIDYTVAVYNDAVAFYNAVKDLDNDYDNIKAEDEVKYQPVKDTYIRFWGEGKTEEEKAKNTIYKSYFAVSDDNTGDDVNNAEKYVKDATTIVDNCINKAHALAIAGDKMAEFKTRIEALPPIVEITKEDEETLNKLKTDLKEFNDVYAVHLDADTKATIENYQWVVDQSLARIKSESDYTMLIVVVAIIAVGFGLYLMFKYVLLPWLKSKRGKRQK